MVQSVIGALRVTLGLDSAQFEQGAKKAKSSLADMKGDFLAAAGAMAAAAGAIGALALKGANDIDKLAKSARRLGSSATSYRALELAADDAGVSVESLVNNFQVMDREVAKGSKGALEGLAKLGLTVEEFTQMEVDEKIATIADRIQELGLSSGETSALLQQFGIRNREMLLLVESGGGAIRQARKDIEEYGLGLTQIQTDKIELANDQISRLAVIGTYLGDQLALRVVPALGAMAQALTDSLREGGVLRMVIDGLLVVMERFAAYALTFVGILGVRYVAAAGLAAAASFTFAGALTFLRGALIRTGIGALIVLAGEMVYQFMKLVEATGGWGNALALLGELAAAVWGYIVSEAMAIPVKLEAVWQELSAGFYDALTYMAAGWRDFLLSMGTAASSIPGFESVAGALNGAADQADAAVANLMEKANNALIRAGDLRTQAGEMVAAGYAPVQSALEKLNVVLSDNAAKSNEAAAGMSNLDQTLEDVGGEGAGGGGGGGGGSAGKAADALEKDVGKALDDAQQKGEQFQDVFVNAFSAIVTGTMTAKEAFSQMFMQLAQMLAQNAFKGLFGSLFGSGVGAGIQSFFTSVPKFASGTNSAPGGIALVGEEGPELVNLPRGSQVVPNAQTMDMMGGSTTNVENKIVNVMDPSVIGQYLGTRDGERMVLNIMKRNGVNPA